MFCLLFLKSVRGAKRRCFWGSGGTCRAASSGAQSTPSGSTAHNVLPHSFLAFAQRSKLARKECGAALWRGAASREVCAPSRKFALPDMAYPAILRVFSFSPRAKKGAILKIKRTISLSPAFVIKGVEEHENQAPSGHRFLNASLRSQGGSYVCKQTVQG